jgi:hypothetical protein
MESICTGGAEVTEDDRMFLVALSRAFNKVSLSMNGDTPSSQMTNNKEGF